MLENPDIEVLDIDIGPEHIIHDDGDTEGLNLPPFANKILSMSREEIEKLEDQHRE